MREQRHSPAKPSASKSYSCGCITKPAEGTASARKAAHNRGSRVYAASTGASLHTVSRAGVAAASRPLRPEARRVIGAGSAIVTTGDGIGLRSGLEAGLGLACPRADLGVAPACPGLAASILSLLRRSDRRVRPPPGRRGAQPSPRPRGSFRLDRSAPAHPSAKPPCHGSPCRSDFTELRRARAWRPAVPSSRPVLHTSSGRAPFDHPMLSTT